MVSRLSLRSFWTIHGIQGKAILGCDIGCQEFSSTTTSKKSITLPTPPKKPMGVYFLFTKDIRANVMKSNPDIKVTDLAKRISERWNKLDDSSKQQYKKIYEANLEQYNKENDAFLARLTASQKQALEEQKVVKKLKQSQRKLHGKLRDLEKPKKARSAFNYYCQHQVQSNSNLQFKDGLAMFATKWRALTPEERKPFEKRAEEDKKRFEREMSAWEKKVKTSGQAEELSLLQDKVKSLKAKMPSVK